MVLYVDRRETLAHSALYCRPGTVIVLNVKPAPVRCARVLEKYGTVRNTAR